jgi:hypothetical protein
MCDKNFIIKLLFTALLILSNIIIFADLSFVKKSHAGEPSSPDFYTSSYKFMVAGHVKGDPDKGTIINPAFSAILKDDSLQDLKFVVLTGDFIDSGTKENRIALEAELNKYPVPFYFVAGNHEQSWGVEGNWERNEYLNWIDKKNLYYSFFHGPDLFVVLEGSEIMASPSKVLQQIKFLKEEIKKKHRFLFVFMHDVLWWKRFKIPTNGSPPKSEIFWTKIIPLLNDLGKEVFVFAGDVGNNGTMFLNKYDNIRLIASGFGHPEGLNNVVTMNVGTNLSFKTVRLDPNVPLYATTTIKVPQNINSDRQMSGAFFCSSHNFHAIALENAKENANLRRKLLGSEKSIEYMKNSYSWKITKYFRKIMFYFKY